MKSRACLLIVSMLLLCAFPFGCKTEQEEAPVCGGWSAPADTTVTEELRAIFSDATAELTDAVYEPLALVEMQVVAGMNYKFLCNMTETNETAETKQVYVTVYRDPDGVSTVTGISSEQ